MTTEAALAIDARGLVKSFRGHRAVRGADLAVPRGSVYGILGPNGAGKSTTIKMLATLVRPDEGQARVLGHDLLREPDVVRSAISLTGQIASVDEDLSGRENLVLLGRLLGLGRRKAKARAAELLEAFELVDATGRLTKDYSGGMRRRLDIAASVIVTPEPLFLDEPTTGLDPRSRNHVWEIVRALAASGTTILLCTQYLDEADQLADGIAIIDHGRVIAEGTPAQLKTSIGTGALHLRVADTARRPETAEILSRVLDADVRLGAEVDEAVLKALASGSRPTRPVGVSTVLAFDAEDVDISPVTHLATATRALMNGSVDTVSLMVVLGTAATLTLVFLPLTTWLYRRA